MFCLFQQLQSTYSFYTWPSAPILAYFLWEHRSELPGKYILELGAGTALPGIVAAKCGANVTLTESALLPKSIEHVKHCCRVNGLSESHSFKISGLTWGVFFTSTLELGHIDLIIGSDCFYEPSLFEDIIVTVAFLLEKNPRARFLSVYQERSSDWSIEHLLTKWNLRCAPIPLHNLGSESGVDLLNLMQDHTIHLLEISKA